MLRLSLTLAFLLAVAVAQNFTNTVIFLKKSTKFGQELFIRGGIGNGQDCQLDNTPEDDPCAIPIEHTELELLGSTPNKDAYALGDDFLTWGGAENDQIATAEGTPAQWTTSDQSQDYFSDLNTYGDDYWMVQVDMDCSVLENDFFEFKGYLNGWESDIESSNCDGDGAEAPSFSSKNHIGRCGYINVFEWGKSACYIESF